MSIHVIIPDTQAKPGVPNDHMEWAGRYIGENYIGRPDLTVIHLGDGYDMQSLSTYDGKRKMEGRRIQDDLDAGNEALRLQRRSAVAYGPRTRRKPRWVYLKGNHENRLERYLDDHPEWEGVVRFDALDEWETHDFLEPVLIDGVTYAHYFYNPMTGRPYGGANVETRLKTIGCSFTMGHQQGLLVGMRSVLGRMHRGLVAGSYYLHDEDYKGPQGNRHWRGILVCHAVEDGDYSLMEVSLDYLCRRYEGVSLADWMED